MNVQFLENHFIKNSVQKHNRKKSERTMENEAKHFTVHIFVGRNITFLRIGEANNVLHLHH